MENEQKLDLSNSLASPFTNLPTHSQPTGASYQFHASVTAGYKPYADAFQVAAPLSSLSSSSAYAHTLSVASLPQPSGFDALQQRDVYRSIHVESFPSSTQHNATADSWHNMSYSTASPFDLKAQQSSLQLGNDLSMLSLRPAHKELYVDHVLDATVTVQSPDTCEVTYDSNVPPCISQFGGYLEPCSHFYSTIASLSLMQLLLSALQSCAVDVTMKSSKFKINCVAYRDGAALSFVVRVFSAGSEAVQSDENAPRFAVEFQRRGGNCAHFYDLFRSCKASVQSAQHDDTTSAASGAVLLSACNEAHEQPPVMPSSSVPNFSPLRSFEAPAITDACKATCEQKRETIRCIVQMCRSECFDIRMNAINALCCFTGCNEPSTAQALREENAIAVFIDALKCKYEHNHRTALTALANMTGKTEDVCAELMKNKDAMKCFFDLANSEVNEVVRQTARGLSNIGTTVGTKSLCAQFRMCLQNLAVCADETARGHVNLLLESLSSDPRCN